jgi:hypothetical protein
MFETERNNLYSKNITEKYPESSIEKLYNNKNI